MIFLLRGYPSVKNAQNIWPPPMSLKCSSTTDPAATEMCFKNPSRWFDFDFIVRRIKNILSLDELTPALALVRSFFWWGKDQFIDPVMSLPYWGGQPWWSAGTAWKAPPTSVTADPSTMQSTLDVGEMQHNCFRRNAKNYTQQFWPIYFYFQIIVIGVSPVCLKFVIILFYIRPSEL